MPEIESEKPLFALLAEGDMRTTGRAEEVVQIVLRQPQRLAELIQCLRYSHPGVRMRAADALEKVSAQHADWLYPYKEVLMGIAEQTGQHEVMWHMAQILPRLIATPDTERLLMILDRYASSKSSIVQACTVEAYWQIVLLEPSRKPVMIDKIQGLVAGGSPAARARARKLLGQH